MSAPAPTTEAASDNGNGKVSMAVIATKLDYLIQRVDSLTELPERVTRVEERQAVDRCEIEKLRTVDRWWNAGNTIAAILAAVVGVRTP